MLLIAVFIVAILICLGIHFGAPELPPRLAYNEQQYPAMVRLSVARQKQSQLLNRSIDDLLSEANREDTRQLKRLSRLVESASLDPDDEPTQPRLIHSRQLDLLKQTVRYPVNWQNDADAFSPVRTEQRLRQLQTEASDLAFDGRSTVALPNKRKPTSGGLTQQEKYADRQS